MHINGRRRYHSQPRYFSSLLASWMVGARGFPDVNSNEWLPPEQPRRSGSPPQQRVTCAVLHCYGGVNPVLDRLAQIGSASAGRVEGEFRLHAQKGEFRGSAPWRHFIRSALGRQEG